MRWFAQLRWPFKPSSALTAAKRSPNAFPIAIEPFPERRKEWIFRRFVEIAAELPWRNSGVTVGPVRFWPAYYRPTAIVNACRTAATTSETYITKLVRLARRENSLLMRVDRYGAHDTTYVLGTKLLRIRCRTLNQ